MANVNKTDICRRMDDVRCSMGEHAEAFVESAQTLTDWRHYARTHPWLFMVGAAAMGFLAVPKRVEIIRPDADALEELARRNKLVVTPKQSVQVRPGMSGTLLTLLANAAVRGVMGYVGQHAGKMLIRGGPSLASSNGSDLEGSGDRATPQRM